MRLLFKHLTPENHRELVDAAAGKSKREVERLIAARFPEPAVPFSVRKLPAATARPVTRPADIKPINEDQFSVRFTARESTWDMLQAAQDLLRHAVPNGDVAEIFDRALRLLLEDLARKKFAATARPRASKGTHPDSRDLPAWLLRAVWVRDCGRCAYVGATGRRCSARGGLEFHHVRPYAEGGKATLDNIRLHCKAHNLHETTEFYGPIRKARGAMSQAIRDGRPRRLRAVLAQLECELQRFSPMRPLQRLLKLDPNVTDSRRRDS